MTRIEPRASENSRAASSWFKKIIKVFSWLIRIPFKLTFRILFFAALIFLFIQIIRTGIWTVPYVSDIFYKKPEPIRIVDPQLYSKELFSLQLSEAVMQSLDQDSLMFYITEGQLTALVETSLATEERPFMTGQTVVENQYIEFFGNLRSNQNIYFTARLIPSVKDNALHVAIDQIKIGSVSLPRSLVSSAASDYLTTMLLQSLLPNMSFRDILLEDRKITFVGISL